LTLSSGVYFLSLLFLCLQSLALAVSAKSAPLSWSELNYDMNLWPYH